MGSSSSKSSMLRTVFLLCIAASVTFQITSILKVSTPVDPSTWTSWLPMEGQSRRAFHGIDDNYEPASKSFTVDILSVGSINRPDYLKAQSETFGQHKSVRNFWGVTEHDDVDQACHANLTWPDVKSICSFCANRKLRMKQSFMMFKMTLGYARWQFLAKKSNLVGWMCAQRRPMQGLYKKALLSYRNGSVPIPDYLLIMDDDTYVDMTMFEENFSGDAIGNRNHLTSMDASATAGCRVKFALSQANFTFPFGGYGYFLSKAAIKRLIDPVYCDDAEGNTSGDVAKSLSPVCRQISEDMFQEAKHFQSGMSVGELMYRYTTSQPYTNHQNWTTGFCVHSDWIWGMLNFYNISNHIDDTSSKRMRDVNQSRLGAYIGSELYAGNLDQPGHRICDLTLSNCHSYAPVCHYSTPTRMQVLTDVVRSRSPEQFRPTAMKVESKRAFVTDMIVASKAQQDIYSKSTAVRQVRVSPSTNVTDCLRSLKQKSKQCDGNTKEFRPDCKGHFLKSFVETVRGYSKAVESMPDYLILLMEPSTYFNMDAIPDHLRFLSIEREDEDNVKPMASSICVSKRTGSFLAKMGLVVNRGVIEMLSRPIKCKENSNGAMNDDKACELIKKNEFGEMDLFRDGMSLLDLLDLQIFTGEENEMDLGRCMGSSGLLSAYINYFDPPGIFDPKVKVKEREIPETNTLQPSGSSQLCRNSGFENCPPEAMACYDMGNDIMQKYSSDRIGSEQAWRDLWSKPKA